MPAPRRPGPRTPRPPGWRPPRSARPARRTAPPGNFSEHGSERPAAPGRCPRVEARHRRPPLARASPPGGPRRRRRARRAQPFGRRLARGLAPGARGSRPLVCPPHPVRGQSGLRSGAGDDQRHQKAAARASQKPRGGGRPVPAGLDNVRHAHLRGAERQSHDGGPGLRVAPALGLRQWGVRTLGTHVQSDGTVGEWRGDR